MDNKNLDSVGEAVTYKIREAITNKLIELNVPFEKELPDYIMVMVANKKSRSQMTEDLFLFLGDGTAEFMNWFESIMKKFQSSSVKQVDDFSFSSTNESKVSTILPDSKVKSNSVSIKPLTNWSNESDILTLEIPEQDADFLGEDLKDVSKSTMVSQNDCKSVEDTLPDVRSVKTAQTSFEGNLKGLQSPSKKDSVSVPESSFSLQQKGKIVPCSAVFPVKRSRTAEEIHSESEEPFGSVASIIRVTERKSSVPLALQANKLLLLKAVDAANKSVMAQQKPIRSTKSADKNAIGLQLDVSPEKDVRIAVLDAEQSSRLVAVQRKLAGAKSSYLLSDGGDEEVNLTYPSAMPDVGVQYEASSRTFEESGVINKKGSGSQHCEKIDKACATEEETSQRQPTISPCFVVTLDGVDPTTLKRKRTLRNTPMEVDSDEACYPRVCLNASTRDFVPLDNGPISEPLEKKLKINEKCRYWPACKSGDLCNYHHPTTTCKAFPNCTYGDKCLFIHPNCKFDALCTRKDCPYTHASKRKIAAEVSPPKKSSFTTVIPCKYFPQCASENCPYFHPRACWYGSACKNRSCPYSHSLPLRDQLKWCAP